MHKLGIAALMAALPISSAAAQQQDHWSGIASVDVTAYCADIRAIHPAMVDPLNPQFRTRVTKACETAAAKARVARSYWDWRNTLQALVTSFRDGHTSIGFSLEPAAVRWPGFLIDGRNNGWVVRHVPVPKPPALAPENDPPEGAAFLGCDGQSANDFLKAKLDNQSVDWSKLPERIGKGFRAFITPHLDGPEPAKSCRFAKDGKVSDVSLAWQRIAYSDLAPQLYPLLRRGPPRPINAEWAADGHVWINLGDVQNETALKELEATLKANQARLRSAPYVVFDLRRNGGGNSMWGEQLASILWGKDAVEARRLADQPTNPNEYGKYWRTSKRAAVGMLDVANEFVGRGSDFAEIVQFYRELAAKVTAVGHDGLLQDECCRPKPMPANIPEPEYKGKVFVLTDAGAFSSGVVVMNTLKRMGAIQVGEVSGQNEIYAEGFGPIDLPSRLGSYRIPFSMIRQPRSALGGLPPDVVWTGAMDDDDGLRKWIASLASSK